jgi:hypothetical protein
VGLVSLWFTKIGATGESFLDQKRVHGVELHPGDGLNTPQKSNHFQWAFNSLSLGKCRAKRGLHRRGHEIAVKHDSRKTRDFSALFPTQFQGGRGRCKIRKTKNVGNCRAEFAFTGHARIQMRGVEHQTGRTTGGQRDHGKPGGLQSPNEIMKEREKGRSRNVEANNFSPSPILSTTGKGFAILLRDFRNICTIS